MKVVFVSKKNLNLVDAVPEIKFFGIFKKRKNVTQALEKYAKICGVESQWQTNITEHGKGEANGFEHSYIILSISEDAPQTIVNLTTEFSE